MDPLEVLLNQQGRSGGVVVVRVEVAGIREEEGCGR